MKKVLIALFLIGLILTLFVSCGKRDNPVRPEYPYIEPWSSGTWTFESLQGNKMEDIVLKNLYVYLPPIYSEEMGHTPGLPGSGFSVLYLLHDFGEDYSYFVGVYKIGQVADRLFYEGQIQPMIIVMPDAYSRSLGGSFYTNSSIDQLTTLIGRYEDYITEELMDSIDALFHTYVVKPGEVILPDPDYRAISGLGMGGYGALKFAFDHDTLFTSVSAMNPYTSFESFLSQETINKVFEENGIASGDNSLASYKSITPYPDTLHPDKTFTQLVFAMAGSFSPAVRDVGDPDTLQFFELRAAGAKRYGVELPFDASRTIQPGSAVWNKWLLFDLKNKLANDPNGYKDLDVYFECGDQNELGLLDGARTFDQFLSLYGKEHEYKEYSGYPGLPAGQNDFIYDRLEEILKFHSRNFPPPAYRGAE
jgi:S-formylglutathione hydrolase FrmB